MVLVIGMPCKLIVQFLNRIGRLVRRLVRLLGTAYRVSVGRLAGFLRLCHQRLIVFLVLARVRGRPLSGSLVNLGRVGDAYV